MAASKSLSVYTLDEATTHFTAALALLDKSPDCALDDQVAQFFVSYTLLLNMNYKIKLTIEILERYLSRIDRLGDDRRAIPISTSLCGRVDSGTSVFKKPLPYSDILRH